MNAAGVSGDNLSIKKLDIVDKNHSALEFMIRNFVGRSKRCIRCLHISSFIEEQSDCEQKSISKPIRFYGVGLHSGNKCELTILPAPADSGLVFRNANSGEQTMALWDRIIDSQLSTVVGMYPAPEWRWWRQKLGFQVQRYVGGSLGRHVCGSTFATIEHLLAAISGAGIDNAVFELSAGEVPILDGSAQPFCEALARPGATTTIPGSRAREIRILRRVVVSEAGGLRSASLEPLDACEHGGCRDLLVTVEVDYGRRILDGAGGAQRFQLWASDLPARAAAARTFTFHEDLAAMRAAGLARGGSLDSAVVYRDGRAVNGLRFADEAARHKALDAVGDLRLAGARLVARYHGVRPGHALNHRLLRALFAPPPLP